MTTTLKDLTGQQFGWLTVVGRANQVGEKPPKWACVCACGQRHVVSSPHLKTGHVKSCGCRKALRQPGLRLPRLWIMEHAFVATEDD